MARFIRISNRFILAIAIEYVFNNLFIVYIQRCVVYLLSESSATPTVKRSGNRESKGTTHGLRTYLSFHTVYNHLTRNLAARDVPFLAR